MLMQRLPSTDNPSPDGIRYLNQTVSNKTQSVMSAMTHYIFVKMGVMQQLLDPLGFNQITLNDNPNQKDHAYGWSAYNV